MSANPTEPLSPGGELLRLDPRTGVLSERHYTISIVEGANVGRSFVLSKRTTIGTAPECDIVLDDTAVSRRHLELMPRPDGIALRDLDSTNGVHVAGVRVTEALVEAEAILAVGRTKLRLAMSDHDVALGGGHVAPFGELIGESPPMQSLFRMLERVAPASSNVVLHGETGTGKDVIARHIHERSTRRHGPFVVFDCAAVAPTLIESELFGHARGAFTGATSARAGAFEQANGGTIFLDEIGDLPLDMQPRLLRALEANAIKRVGETGYRRVDVRVIAATHRDLGEEVVRGRFRSDLFYRLSVMLVRVPALRERRGDLPLLVEHFVRKLGRATSEFPAHMLTRFEAHDWPGNVRELRNEVERALLLPREGVDEAMPASRVAPPAADKSEALEARHARILDALARRAGNQKLAAQDLGISRRTLLNWLDEHGIARPRKGTS